MNSNDLIYLVNKEQFIVNWLTSKVIETPFVAKMVPTVFHDYHPGSGFKKEDGKEHRSPAKDEFLDKGIFRNSAIPTNIEIGNLYWPFDTQRVDFSGFWHMPCDITFYAKAYIISNSEIDQLVEICTCGAVKIWINGNEAVSFYPYESNIEMKQTITLPLKKGKNEIIVGCNNYGERNIVFNFGIKNLGDALTVMLPISADIEKMQSINKSLEAMYLDRLSYSVGEIHICTDFLFQQDTNIRVTVCGIEKELFIESGKNEFCWGNVEELPIGYHEFLISSDVDGIGLKQSLWAEVYPKHLEHHTPTLLEDRKQLALEFIIKNTQPSFEQFIAHLALGVNKYEDYRSNIESLVSHVKNRGDCSDFRVIKILWVLCKFRNLLTKEQVELFEKTLLEFRYWFDEKGNDAMWFFSENHALCFHTGQMLAGEMFKEEIFTNSGLTGAQQVQKAKALIIEWFEKLLKYGYNEWNSTAYIPVDILSYISLLELCKDEEIQDLAKKALDYTYEVFAKNSFHGLMGTSNGRIYPRELLANRNIVTNTLLWLAWGEGCLNSSTDPLIFMALSAYQPPEHLSEVAHWDKKDKLVIREEQGTFHVPTVLCKTIDYILGTCITPRTGGPGSQEHLINIFLKDYRSRIWINHPGEGKIFGEKRPGYFTGNGLTPLVTQKNNVAVMSYHFDNEMISNAEVQFTHIFCDLSECDEVIFYNCWMFLRRSDAFIAIYAENGLKVNDKPPLKNKEILSLGINNTWFVKVSAFPEIESFTSFTDWMRNHVPTKKDQKLFYEDYEYGLMEFDLM